MRRHDYFRCICVSPLPVSIQKLKNLFEVLEAVRTPCSIRNCFRRKGKKNALSGAIEKISLEGIVNMFETVCSCNKYLVNFCSRIFVISIRYYINAPLNVMVSLYHVLHLVEDLC